MDKINEKPEPPFPVENTSKTTGLSDNPLKDFKNKDLSDNSNQENEKPSEIVTQIKDIKNDKNLDQLCVSSPVSPVTQRTQVTQVTQDMMKVTRVTGDTSVVTYSLGKEVLDDIFLTIISCGKALSYKDISINLNKEIGVIKKTMIRNKIYFQEHSKDSYTKFWTLSNEGIDYINKKILEYTKREQKRISEIEKIKYIQKTKEDLYYECKILLNEKDYELIENSIYFDFYKIAETSPQLSEAILTNPKEFFELISSNLVSNKVKDIRIKNLPKDINIPIEGIRKDNINKLISIEGRIVSMSSVKPMIVSIKFECPSCGSVINITQNENIIKEPSRCSCGRRGQFKIISKDSENISRIILEDLQERTDNPHTQRLKCIISNDLVNNRNIKIFTPGNEIKCSGILEEVPIKINGKISTICDYVLLINNAELSEQEVEIEKFSEEEIKDIKRVSKRIDQYGIKEITDSFAPEIYGYEYIKNAIILQLCNSRNKINPTGIKNVRNKPNILLIGDPGVSKSVLGDFVMDITPHSRKATGGGSSAVGITASVVKEEESMGGYRVEPGALVLAKDILFLDELNNLQEEDKPKLQEGMSEQRVSINKANLHVKLKVTAGILSAANPVSGHFDINKDYIDQFNIPSPILTRFDEIFIIKDTPDFERDSKIAQKMIDRESGNIKPLYSKEFLKKFFVYIRNFDEPLIDEKIGKKLKILYSESRKKKTHNLIISPRFMETLIRLIKASAKLRLSERIDEKDLEVAIDILSKSHFNIEDYKHFNFNKTGEEDLQSLARITQQNLK